MPERIRSNIATRALRRRIPLGDYADLIPHQLSLAHSACDRSGFVRDWRPMTKQIGSARRSRRVQVPSTGAPTVRLTCRSLASAHGRLPNSEISPRSTPLAGGWLSKRSAVADQRLPGSTVNRGANRLDHRSLGRPRRRRAGRLAPDLGNWQCRRPRLRGGVVDGPLPTWLDPIRWRLNRLLESKPHLSEAEEIEQEDELLPVIFWSLRRPLGLLGGPTSRRLNRQLGRSPPSSSRRSSVSGRRG